MRYLILILTALFLSACAPESPKGSSAAAVSAAPVYSGPAYAFKIFGTSNTFACIFWSNFGAGDQVEFATGVQTVTSAASKDWSVNVARNVVGQCAQHTGAGTITVQIFKAGVLVETKVSAGNGTSASFNIDIQ